MTADKVKKELKKLANPEKATIMMRFFKTGLGEYGEGDIFIGLTVPEMRKVAKDFKAIELSELQKLVVSKIHEERFTALVILTYKFTKADESEQKSIYDFYLKNLNYVNNWDLVDVTTPKVVGAYMLNHEAERKKLYKWAKSKSLWERRIAMLATYAFLKQGQFEDTFKLAEILLHDGHDLIHKAVGWMLREIGKLDQEQEEKFLKKYYQRMPRTMLRYAIEKFEEEKREKYLMK